MTEHQAQEIVYAFADVLADGAAIVCDEDSPLRDRRRWHEKKGNSMGHVIASVLLLILVLNISRKIANAITKGILFSKPFIQLLTGLTWGIGIAIVVAAFVGKLPEGPAGGSLRLTTSHPA